jgi:hypothetical protein
MPKPKSLRVWYVDDEPVEVRISTSVQIQAEEEFNTSIMEMNRLKQQYWIVWTALVKAGKETRTFEEFTDVVVDVEPVEAPDSMGPTEEAQSSDTSLN